MFKKIKNRDDVELKVCKGCDAPLPYKPEKISYFKKRNDICDDCLQKIWLNLFYK